MSRRASSKCITVVLLLLLGSVVIAGAAGSVTQQRVLAESGTGDNWFLNGGDFRGQHFSPLVEINTGNVANLGLTWSLDLPAPYGELTADEVEAIRAYVVSQARKLVTD